jgi:hypothetical protein
MPISDQAPGAPALPGNLIAGHRAEANNDLGAAETNFPWKPPRMASKKDHLGPLKLTSGVSGWLPAIPSVKPVSEMLSQPSTHSAVTPLWASECAPFARFSSFLFQIGHQFALISAFPENTARKSPNFSQFPNKFICRPVGSSILRNCSYTDLSASVCAHLHRWTVHARRSAFTQLA